MLVFSWAKSVSFKRLSSFGSKITHENQDECVFELASVLGYNLFCYALMKFESLPVGF